MKKNLPKILIVLSVLAAIMSGYVFLTQKDLFSLAGTQWILISVVLGVYAVYALGCPCCNEGGCCGKAEEK